MSNETKHTPGPWEYADEDSEPCVIAGDYYVATAHVGQPGDTIGDSPVAHANARLIAAAPDLLAALQEQVEAFDKQIEAYRQGDNDAIAVIALQVHGKRMERSRRAISKAEGKS